METFLSCGAVKLLNAQWIIQRAAQGIPISRRQELPSDAFLSLEEIKVSASVWHLPIMCLSYVWLHPNHPDPKGDTLLQLALFLAASSKGLIMQQYRVAVFWDFASLHQHDPRNQTRRSEEEEELFQRGLGAISSLYGHPRIQVVQVTELPSDYPSAYYHKPQSIVPFKYLSKCLTKAS